jgi:hypothetical protein
MGVYGRSSLNTHLTANIEEIWAVYYESDGTQWTLKRKPKNYISMPPQSGKSEPERKKLHLDATA